MKKLFRKKDKTASTNKKLMIVGAIVLFILIFNAQSDKYSKTDIIEKVKKTKSSIGTTVQDNVKEQIISLVQGRATEKTPQEPSIAAPKTVDEILIEKLSTNQDFANDFYKQLELQVGNKKYAANMIANYKQQVKQAKKNMVTYRDIQQGTAISEAVCGANITIKYDVFADGTLQEKGKIRNLSLNKNNAVYDALNGLRKGGKREIIIPESLFSDFMDFGFQKYKSSSLKLSVSMIKSSFTESGAKDNMVIFDQLVISGRKAECGQKIKTSFRIKSLSKKIGKWQDVKDFTFKIGEGKVPYGFELGFLNLLEGSTRMIILPRELLKTGQEHFPQEIKPLLNDNIVVKITNMNLAY
jgi:FKBP-type peptidyl-prolyl cis-trans isomerase